MVKEFKTPISCHVQTFGPERNICGWTAMSESRVARKKFLRRRDAQYWRHLPKCVLILLGVKAGQSSSRAKYNPQNEKLIQSVGLRPTGVHVPFHTVRFDQEPETDDEYDEEAEAEEDTNSRRLLSRFGVSLLISLCNEPINCKSTERLGRLVSMVMTWVESTASFERDHYGELLKRLAGQYACRWLVAVRESNLELFCKCLSPNPPEYVKVGGCWDRLSSTVRQHTDGLGRVAQLIPHQLLTVEVSAVFLSKKCVRFKANTSGNKFCFLGAHAPQICGDVVIAVTGPQMFCQLTEVFSLKGIQ